MREIILFCEDSFHERFVLALLRRFQVEEGLPVAVKVLTSRGGLPRMRSEFKDFLRDLERDRQSPPDSIIVVVDANCMGHNDRKSEMGGAIQAHPRFEQLVSFAIPDPHLERWMLADPQAFRAVFQRGCTTPAVKCAKSEYKRLLRKEISASGIDPPLGGEEYAEEIVNAMNLAYVESAESSLGLFLTEVKALFRRWKQ